MRLIDADALPKYTGYALSADEVARAVENAPTIEAEPVRRGKWIAFHQSGDLGYKCSSCNRHAYGVDVEMFGGDYNYCPNCGAKMEV